MQTNDVKIAWVISAYQKPEQLIHIINRIIGEHDSVWLHYDKKSPKSEFDYLSHHFGSDSRIRVFRKYNIFWGGIEITLTDCFLAKELLESTHEFDYVIHFTGTTYPIKRMDQFREFLSKNYGKTFIELDPDEIIHENGSPRSQHFAKEHFGVYPGRNIPKYDFINRVIYKINLKFLRLLNRLGAIKGKTFLPKAFPKIYRGYVHNVVFKDHYLAALNDQRTKQFLREIKYISCPDEVFFNTILTNTVPSDLITKDNNLLVTYWRKGNASPDNIQAGDLPNLIQSDRFFARKFESMDILKAIDRNLANPHKEKC